MFLPFNRTGAAHKFFQNCLLVEKVGLPLARCKRQDRGKIAAQHDHQFRTIGHEIDTADQRAELVGRHCAHFFIAQLVVESSDLLMIIFCQIGMQQGRWFFCAIEEAGQLFLAGFEFGAAFLDHIHRHSVLEIEIKDLFELPVDPFRLSLRGVDGNTSLHPRLVHFTRELVAKLLAELRFHQMLVEPVQNGLFEGVAADVQPIVTSPLGPGVGAAEHVLRNHGIAATTAAAFDEPGEQVFWPAAFVQDTIVARLGSGLQRQLVLPCLHCIPQVLIDDAQVL
nr:hypothetical protein [Rhizobium gei]